MSAAPSLIFEIPAGQFESDRVTSGPLRDGLAINARDLARRCGIREADAKAALAELQRKGFIVNLTPELSIDRAVVRLTMFSFQGEPPTHDYQRYEPTPAEADRIAEVARWKEREARRRGSKRHRRARRIAA
jgi:hypothetical protein